MGNRLKGMMFNHPNNCIKAPGEERQRILPAKIIKEFVFASWKKKFSNELKFPVSYLEQWEEGSDIAAKPTRPHTCPE